MNVTPSKCLSLQCIHQKSIRRRPNNNEIPIWPWVPQVRKEDGKKDIYSKPSIKKDISKPSIKLRAPPQPSFPSSGEGKKLSVSRLSAEIFLARSVHQPSCNPTGTAATKHPEELRRFGSRAWVVWEEKTKEFKFIWDAISAPHLARLYGGVSWKPWNNETNHQVDGVSTPTSPSPAAPAKPPRNPPRNCSHCKQALDENGKTINSNGDLFHARCFVCAQCFRPFEEGVFFEFEGRKYCQHDFQVLDFQKKKKLFPGSVCSLLCQVLRVHHWPSAEGEDDQILSIIETKKISSIRLAILNYTKSGPSCNYVQSNTEWMSI